MIVFRGEIYYADLNGTIGSEQGSIRPVVIIQNDVGNKFSPTTIVAPITTRKKNKMPTHVKLKNCGLERRSMALLEQVRTIDKSRLLEKVGEVSESNMERINTAIKISLEIE